MSTITPEIKAEAERQAEVLRRGVVEIYPKDGLETRLAEALAGGRQLKVKLGCDPTAPDLHLGHTVVLQKLRQFQDLGHTAQLVIGGATALIGDPTGKSKTRPPLSAEDVATNAQTYLQQAKLILREDRLEILDNRDWLHKMGLAELLKLMAHVTVAQLIEREDFAKRLNEGRAIAMHELMYPIMQGYDSVAMDSDIELGGTDQTFNCLMGRALQKAHGKAEQVVMTLPLLEGLDGVQKMSKSLGNYVGLTDAPNDMFGKLMSIPDEMMPKYFELLTQLELDKLPAHPMAQKKLLAHTLTARFHDTAAADAAQADFETRFSKREVPEELPEHAIATENGEIGLAKLLVDVGFAETNSAARRLIQGGGVRIDDEKIEDIRHHVKSSGNRLLLRAGKRNMAYVTLT